MEQRVQDLIEQLQRYDGDTRIEGYVNLKWNDKRTALVATEDNLLEKIDDRDGTIETIQKECDEKEEYITELEAKLEDVTRSVSEIEKENTTLNEHVEELEIAYKALEEQHDGFMEKNQ